MPEIATAWVSVIADTRQIPGQIRQAFGQTDRIAQQQGRQAGRSFSGAFGTSLKAAGTIAGAAGGIAAIGAAMRSSIGSGLDFTSALNTLQAVSGATAQQVAEVGRRARELGTDSQLASTSSIDAANAMLELSKGGFSVSESMQAARGTLQLAAAAQINAAEAATIQSQALQAFGKDASYAGKTADILANAANASSAEITDVAQALQQSGTVANQFGLSMTDTAASIAMMANAGIQGSDAGTLLKSALLALTDGGQPAQTAIEQLGLSVYDANGKFAGMQTLFGELHAASKRMTPEMYQAATATLFGSDAMRLSGIAAQQGAEGFASMRAAMDRTGSAADVAAAKMQGLPGAWEKLKNSAQDAGLAFYDVVEGPLTGAATKASEVLGDLVGNAQSAGNEIRNAFNDPQAEGILKNLRDDTGSAFQGLSQAAIGLGPSLGAVLEQLAKVGAALGVSTWSLFLEVVQASTGVLQGLEPLLSGAASLIGSNTGAVTALAAAWLAFKTIPSIVGRVTSAVSPMTTAVTGARASMQSFAQTNTAMARGLLTNRALMAQMAGVVQTANGRWQTLSGQSITAAQAMQRMNTVAAAGVTQFGRFGSAISQMGSHSPAILRMQSAFVQAQMGANSWSRTAGTAAAAGAGFRAAASGIAGVFGGPLGLALAGGAVATTLVASEMAEARTAANNFRSASDALGESQRTLQRELIKSRGAITDNSFSAATGMVDQWQEKLKAAEAQHQSTWETIKSFNFDSGRARDNIQAREAMDTREALRLLGMTSEDVARRVTGSATGYEQLRAQLLGLGDHGRTAARDLHQMRAEVLGQQDAARRLSPGIMELGDAFTAMGDSGTSAGDKLKALKAAMDALNPSRNKAEATAQFGEAVREVASSLSEIDSSAFRGGQLDDMSVSGAKLGRTLGDLAEKAGQVASTGGNMGMVSAELEKKFAELATATNQPIAKIRELYKEFGGGTVDLVVSLSGESEAVQGMGKVYAAFKAQPDKKSIELEAIDLNGEAIQKLNEFGIKVEKIPGTSRVRVEATTDEAKARLDALIGTLSAVPPGKAINVSAPGGDSVLTMLHEMGAKVTTDNFKNIVVESPLAPAVLEQLRALGIEVQTNNGKTILVRADDLDYRTKLPKWTQTEYKKIIVEAAAHGISPAVPGMPGVAGPVAANSAGMIRYADGGISEIERYANLHGLQAIDKPKRADIFAGRGAGSIFAEEETGGEAYVPLAQSKRRRSTDILATVADLFGYSLIPQERVPDSLSGLLGAVTGSAIKRLAQGNGLDGYRRFAEGGITTTVTSLKDYMRGIDNGQYVWGGWGNGWNTDCSGGQSIIANAVRGNLNPGTGERAGTGAFSSFLPRMGYRIGQAPAGTPAHEVGWSPSHASGTIFDPTGGDVNVEMGGVNGNGKYASQTGSRDAQFPNQAWIGLPPASLPPGSVFNQDPTGYGTPTDPSTTPSATPSAAPAGSGEDKTLSGRLGNAASAFVSGQVTDLFGVLSINDQPGWLAAITEYENQQRQKQQEALNGTKGDKSVQGKKVKVKSIAEAEEDLANARADLDIAHQRQRELKPDAKESTRMSTNNAVTKAEQKLRDAEAELREAKANPSGFKYVAPDGTTQQQDQTPGLPTTGNTIKDAFRSGLREAWRQGPPWDATDWIVNKESTWNMGARNGKYFGGGQYSPEAWAAAGKQPSADPRVNGEVFDHYVGERYGDPLKAKEHHVNAGWYERGGVIHEGANIMLNGLGHKETALPFDPRDLKASLDRGGSGSSEAVVAKLDQLLQVLAHNVRGTTYNVSDDHSLKRAQRSEKQRIATTLAGL